MSLTPDFTQNVSSVLHVLLRKLHGIEYTDCQKTKTLFRYILSHFSLNTIMEAFVFDDSTTSTTTSGLYGARED